MGVVLLVRHGQASFGAPDYDMLSETGWEQGRRLGTWLAERRLTPSHVISGKMRRHRETAEALLDGAGWVLDVNIDAAWDETHLAEAGGRHDPSTAPLDSRAFQRVLERSSDRWTSGDHDGEYEESWADFATRVRDALGRASEQAGPGRTVAVVTSGGPIAATCSALVMASDDEAVYARLWNSFNTMIVNSSLTRLVVGSTGVRMLTFNEHSHLEGKALTYR